MEPLAGDNRRRFPRFAADTQVCFQLEGEPAADRRRGWLENVARGGVFIATEEPCPEGETVRLQLLLGGGEREIEVLVRAVVRWVRRRFTPHGMGLELVEFEGEGRKAYESWLQAMVCGKG